jgi:hypothetical protein
MMQLCPGWQSADVWQATWQMPHVHTKEPPQSLLSMQVPPTSIFLAPLHPARSHAEAIIKPRMRDVDIPILRVFGRTGLR